MLEDSDMPSIVFISRGRTANNLTLAQRPNLKDSL